VSAAGDARMGDLRDDNIQRFETSRVTNRICNVHPRLSENMCIVHPLERTVTFKEVRWFLYRLSVVTVNV